MSSEKVVYNRHITPKRVILKVLWIVVLGTFTFLMVFPLIIMILTSLKSNSELRDFFPKKLLFSNYKQVWERTTWGVYFRNTAIITVCAVAFSLVFNSIAGYAFARLRFRGKKILFAFLLIGLMLPEQLTLLPTFLIMVRFPLLGGNNIMGQGGTGLYNTLAGILLPMMAGSFGVFFCRQFFRDFPSEVDDAVVIDGGNRWQAYFYIYLPNAKPLFATLGLSKFVSSWNSYMWPLIMTSSKNMRTLQMALQMFKEEESMVQWNLMMGGTTLVALPVLILFLFLQRYFISTNISAGIK